MTKKTVISKKSLAEEEIDDEDLRPHERRREGAQEG